MTASASTSASTSPAAPRCWRGCAGSWSSPSCGNGDHSPRELPQGRLQERRELRLSTELLPRGGERRVGVLGAIAEVHQRGVNVVVDRRARRRGGGGCFGRLHQHELVA